MTHPAPPTALLEHFLGVPGNVAMAMRWPTVSTELRQVFNEWADQLLSGEPDAEQTRTDLAAEVLQDLVLAQRRAAWLSGLLPAAVGDGLQSTEDGLLPADAFEPFAGVFERQRTWYFLMPTLTSFNSSYWLALLIPRVLQHARVKLRLDPFAHIPKGSPMPVYKAWCFGPEPSWSALGRLRGDAFLRAAPTAFQTDVAFTDIVWRGRADGTVVLQCEEVRKLGHHHRPARYFHSVYHPETECFEHMDGAVRFYDAGQLQERLELDHLRHAGKCGARRKLFVADGKIPRDLWAEVFAAFYVWNDDISRYVEALSAADGPGIYSVKPAESPK